jgi:hypothetical protein
MPKPGRRRQLRENPTTEDIVPISDADFDMLRERTTRVESSVQSIADTVGQLATTQQQMQQAQATQASDMQSILTLLRSREGRVDVKMMLTVGSLLIAVIFPLLGVIAAVFAMYLSPLKTQLDNAQSQAAIGLAEVRRSFDDFRESDGTTKVQLRLAIMEERQAAMARELGRREPLPPPPAAGVPTLPAPAKGS